MGKIINEEILTILSRVTVKGNAIFLTCGQLDRKQYKAVNDVIENMGGKWNRKTKGHIFSEDPTDKLDQVLLSGEIVQPKKYGYFPTPPELAMKIIDMAEVEPCMNVLEPSAGQGAIADFMPDGCQVDCIELLSDNVDVLEKKGYLRLIHGDFLEVEVSPFYDRVVMNPPFEKQQDIDHVRHAWNCLVDGGRLVSIMSAGVLFRENKKTVEFRDFVGKYGYFERLPEGIFKESGTGVNTCIVVLDKP